MLFQNQIPNLIKGELTTVSNIIQQMSYWIDRFAKLPDTTAFDEELVTSIEFWKRILEANED